MNESINVTNAEKCALDEKTIGRPASGQNSARSPLVAVSTAGASSASHSTAASRSPLRQVPASSDSKEGANAAVRRASTLPPQPKAPSSVSVSVHGRSSVPVVESGEVHRNCPAASHSPVSSSTTTSSSTIVPNSAAHLPPSKSAHASATSTVAPNTSAGSHSATSSSANSSHGCSTTRSRRILNFTASAFKALRLKRLALYNPKLLRKYGITSVQIRNTNNGEALQRFELPKNCSPSPPPPPVKHRPPPQATAFTPIPQPVIGAPSSSVRALSARTSKTKLAMEQRAAVAQQQQIGRMPPNMPPHQQTGMPMQQGRMDQMMQEPGTSGNCNDTPLLMNLLSNNNANQMNSSGNGMPQQPQTPVHQQPMNPNMMRYAQQPNAQQPMQAQHSPMYPGAQQSPHYMQGNAMQAGRMMPGHPMSGMNQQQMMMQQPGGQSMAPPPQQLPAPTSQSAESSPKKRKRQTKKQKAEEEAAKKQREQQQQQQQAASGQIQHPNQHYAPQMWAPEYAMHQQGGQQRVPPVNMHVPPAQYRMQYNYIHYQQPNSMMSGGAPPQYPNQHYMQQQGWHPNMQQQHMGQYSQQQQPPQYPNQNPQNVHYAAQQSPAPDMKGHRMGPPGYNQQFMSPPPQHPNSNYQMQQTGQNPQQQQQQQQMVAAQQHQSQAQQNQMHQRASFYDLADNVDDLVATLSSEADDFDLDSIELEPIRGDGPEMGGLPNPQHMVQNQHPGGQQNAHWSQYNGASAAPNYQIQQGAPQGYYAGQQPQTQQQTMPPVYPGNPHGQMQPAQQPHPNSNFPSMQSYQQQMQQQQQQQQQTREMQQKSREIQDKKEREQLEQAMQKSPSAPTTPSAEPVPEAQQRSIANTIDFVFEKVMSGRSDEATSSGSQSAPPAKRKKQTAKAAAQQQEQPTPPPPQHPMYPQQQHSGTPTGFPPGYTGGPPTPQQQQQQFYFQQQQRMQQQRQSMGNGGPPVSTPDSVGGFYHGQQMGGHPAASHNGAHTPQRSNSMKNVLTGGSNPHTPQTPQTAPPTAMSHPLAQQPPMQPQIFNENGGGGSSASSTAATPAHRGNADEAPIGIKEETPQSAPPHSFPQQSPYAQFNGHAALNQHFSFHPNDESKLANAVNPAVSNAVSLKSHIVDSNADLCTPPSANAMSSATPTTASQQDHGDGGGIKSEVNDVKRELLERNESEQIVGNGPANSATTSAVAE